ncbi:MAG: dimethylsulfonioproprionate lyase family protein [Acetobacter sp.]
MRGRILWYLVVIGLIGHKAHAARFVCQDDVKPADLTAAEQKLVDRFWAESLVYLQQYLKVLETPTGGCQQSAQATVQTYLPATGREQTRCILDYGDMALLAKHVKAVLAEPDKARACFDPQKNYRTVVLYTPGEQVRSLSPTSQWLKRPLLTDYFRKMGGPIGAAGLELNENFVAVTSRVDTRTHWAKDVSIRALPTLWSSVGWIPLYAANPDAGSARFRGGYLYAELMGPWGNLRIRTIDGERVGAEIGMTVQLFNTSYPFHYHHPQEMYMTLTRPECIDQNRYMVMHWDNDQFRRVRGDKGWTVEIDGTRDRWKKWFLDQDSNTQWLTYIERNAIHAFYARDGCNQTIANSGLVSVWARTTARDNEQITRLCEPAPGAGTVEDMGPGKKTVCALRDWQQ